MLEVSGLRKSYARHRVLDLDFRLEPGDFCLLLGENGAGKSTFFRCLLGLEPFSGSVRVDGGNPRGRIAGVLDQPMMYPRWTAARYMRYMLGASDAVTRPPVATLVNPQVPKQRIGRLSTGEKKLVLLATALAADANIVLLDEFAIGLDQAARRRFRLAVRDELQSERSFVATGHDLAAFGSLPTRVVVMRGGSLTDITAAYRSQNDIERLYEDHVTRTDA